MSIAVAETVWNGFRPLEAYSLDSAKISLLPLLKITGEQEANRVPTTIREVYEFISERPFEVEMRHMIPEEMIEITSGTEKLILTGLSFNVRMLTFVLGFVKDGISPRDTSWFWYETDTCRDDPQRAYSFFIVNREKIIRERAQVFEHYDSGFDPTVFETNNDPPIWNHERDWAEARIRFLYRKFFTDTYIGQLFVLRKDSQDWVTEFLQSSSRAATLPGKPPQEHNASAEAVETTKLLSSLCWLCAGILGTLLLMLILHWK